MLKMLRLLRVLKLAKVNDSMQKKKFSIINIEARFERLAILGIIISYMIHVTGCVWLIIGSSDLENRDSWF